MWPTGSPNFMKAVMTHQLFANRYAFIDLVHEGHFAVAPTDCSNWDMVLQ